MRKIISFFTVVLLIAAIYSTVNADRGIKHIKKSDNLRLALVIGNSDYKSGPLRNPENDAREIARALSMSGFEVTLRINASQRDMETAVRGFGKKLYKGGVGLFYYAGHGIQVNGRNYLIPIDATIESETDVKYEAVDAGLILGKMEDAGNGLNIVILDACRNNPFARSFRSVEQGLARMDAPKGSLIAYATAPGSVAADGSGENGVFTKHLIKNIQIPGLTIEQILKQVRIAVVNETSSRQVPWESSSLMGNFYFHSGDVKIEFNALSPQFNSTPIPPKTMTNESILPAGNPNSGKVRRITDSGGYTYILIDKGKGQIWIAILQTRVDIGDMISWKEGMTMKNFRSRTLNKTFDSIVFSGGLVGS